MRKSIENQKKQKFVELVDPLQTQCLNVFHKTAPHGV